MLWIQIMNVMRISAVCWVIHLLLIASVIEVRGEDRPVFNIFCHYSTSASYKSGEARFVSEDVDPKLCTHIILTFVEIREGSTLVLPFLDKDHTTGPLERVFDWKKINPGLKILVAVGGWVAGSDQFVSLVRSSSNKISFIRSVIVLLREHRLDGLDIDWEFPGTRGSDGNDKYLFTQLLQDVYRSFQLEHEKTGRDKLLLAVTVSGGSYYINLAYEANKIARYADFVLLASYNYHGDWNKFTGHHSALFPHSQDKNGENEWNQAWSVDFWLGEGSVPPNKLIMGIPAYGRTFTLKDQSQHGLRAPSEAPGRSGKFTQESGILAYYEICENLRSGWKSVWIRDQRVPYAYSGDQWMGYEDSQSVLHKANYVVDKRLGGAFIWALELDDFRGTCQEGRYPLLSTIHKVFDSASNSLDSVKYNGENRESIQRPFKNSEVGSKFESERSSKDLENHFSGSELGKILEIVSKLTNKEEPNDNQLKDNYGGRNSEVFNSEFTRHREKVFDKNYDRNSVLGSSYKDNFSHNKKSEEESVDRKKKILMDIISEKLGQYLENNKISEPLKQGWSSYDENLNRRYHEREKERADNKENVDNYDWINDIINKNSEASKSKFYKEDQSESHRKKYERDISKLSDGKVQSSVKDMIKDSNNEHVFDNRRSNNELGLPKNTQEKYLQDSHIDPNRFPLRKDVEQVNEFNGIRRIPLQRNTEYERNIFEKPNNGLEQRRDLRFPLEREPASVHYKYSKNVNKMDNLVDRNFSPDVPNERNQLGMKCENSGLYPDGSSCRLYYICVPHGAQWFKFSLTCPPGHAFVAQTASCQAMHDCLD